MRNIISLAHISLDGFMAGPGGDMDFIVFNDELADHTYPLIATGDLAVYGRVTYELMEGYWPTAGPGSMSSWAGSARPTRSFGRQECDRDPFESQPKSLRWPGLVRRALQPVVGSP